MTSSFVVVEGRKVSGDDVSVSVPAPVPASVPVPRSIPAVCSRAPLVTAACAAAGTCVSAPPAVSPRGRGAGTTVGSVAAASTSFASAFASASDEVDGASGTTSIGSSTSPGRSPGTSASEDAPLVATPRSANRPSVSGTVVPPVPTCPSSGFRDESRSRKLTSASAATSFALSVSPSFFSRGATRIAGSVADATFSTRPVESRSASASATATFSRD